MATAAMLIFWAGLLDEKDEYIDELKPAADGGSYDFPKLLWEVCKRHNNSSR